MEKTFDILTGPLNWSLNHVIYSFECKQCHFYFPYSGSKKHVDKDLAIVIKKVS